MTEIKALPQKIKIQRFVWNRFQRLATRTSSFVAEV